MNLSTLPFVPKQHHQSRHRLALLAQQRTLLKSNEVRAPRQHYPHGSRSRNRCTPLHCTLDCWSGGNRRWRSLQKYLSIALRKSSHSQVMIHRQLDLRGSPADVLPGNLLSNTDHLTAAGQKLPASPPLQEPLSGNQKRLRSQQLEDGMTKVQWEVRLTCGLTVRSSVQSWCLPG